MPVVPEFSEHENFHGVHRSLRADFPDVHGVDVLAVFMDLHVVAIQTENAFCRKTNDRITTPGFAAFHRFEQIGVRTIGQFQIDGKRCIEIRQDLADNRDAVVAFSSELLELFLSDHAVFPCRHYSWTWFDGHGCAVAMTIASRETNCSPRESWPYFSDFRAHLSNNLFVVRSIEDCRACDKGVGTGGGNLGDVV